MSEPPRHRHEMTLELGANTLDDLTFELRDIADRLEREQQDGPREITSGSSTAGYHLRIDHDPTMTPERFRDELAAWAEQERAHRQQEVRGL